MEIKSYKKKNATLPISLGSMSAKKMKKTSEILAEFRTMNPTTTYIFENEFGKPIPGTLPRKWLQQIVKDSDMRPIKIHGFRHTHSSLCFEAGMTLKQVQYRLGHSDLKRPLNFARNDCYLEYR